MTQVRDLYHTHLHAPNDLGLLSPRQITLHSTSVAPTLANPIEFTTFYAYLDMHSNWVMSLVQDAIRLAFGETGVQEARSLGSTAIASSQFSTVSSLS